MSKYLKSLLMMAVAFSVVETSTAAAQDKLETAPNKTVEANGIKFSYRSFGKTTGTPLVLLQHFTGTMDYWDPAVVNGLAKERPVVVFNNTGVGKTSGATPDNVEQMATDAVAFINALGLKKVDLLGYSLGGFIAQEVAAKNPELVRKVILAGTGVKGGGNNLMKVVGEAFSQKDSPDPRLYLFFTQTSESQQAGKEFIKRSSVRADRDPESGKPIMDAQGKALIVWTSTPDDNALLKSISQPVLIVQGSNDTMLPTESSITMFKNIKNAELILYPDSNHGSIFQHHDEFVNQANFFLNK